jgi:hypothetical protein
VCFLCPHRARARSSFFVHSIADGRHGIVPTSVTESVRTLNHPIPSTVWAILPGIWGNMGWQNNYTRKALCSTRKSATCGEPPIPSTAWPGRCGIGGIWASQTTTSGKPRDFQGNRQPIGIAGILGNLGEVANALGDYEEAAQHAGESLTFSKRLDLPESRT